MKALGVVGFFFLLVSCAQDPFKNLTVGDSPQQVIDHLAPYSIDLPPILNFLEGEEREFEVFVRVPETGTPMLTVKGLPAGASFDETNFVLKWKPSLQSANDPNNPLATVRTYPVTFYLSSTEDPQTTVERNVELMVAERFDTTEVKLNPAILRLDEGKPTKVEMLIKSEEFPQGPFLVRSDDMPPGTTIHPVSNDPNKFTITVNAPFDFVTQNYSKQTQVSFVVEAPNKRTVVHTAQWTIYNQQQYPLMTAPTEVTQGPAVNFTVQLEDINGEQVPELDLYQPAPFGKVQITKVYEKVIGKHPAALFNVEWTEIPASKFGTSAELVLYGCVRQTCKRHVVKANLRDLNFPLPVVDRAAWPIGEIRYGKVGKSQKISLPVKDGATGPKPKVEILPASAAADIVWEQNSLLIKPQSVGLKQFRVKATSQLGATMEETFFIEVLPKARPERLLLVDTQESSESKKNIAVMGAVDVVNPVWQPLEGKLTALRDVLVAGTQVFSYDAAIAEIEKASTQISTVFLMTPLLEKLQGSLKAELEDIGLTMVGKLQNVVPGPTLAEYQVVAKGPLTVSQKPVVLEGTLSSSSASPLLLKVADEQKCVPLLKLVHTVNSSEVLVAVSCKRANGGSLIVSGIEWGDLKLEAEDAELVKKWVSEVLP